MTPCFFRVDRTQHAYLTFIIESYEGICTLSTVDNAKGIVRVLPSEGQEEDLEGLLAALRDEINMEKASWPDC